MMLEPVSESIRYLGRQYHLQRIDESTQVKLNGRLKNILDLSGQNFIRQKLINWYY